MTKNYLALIATSMMAASMLVGCELEGDACSTDSECGGYKCVLPAAGSEEEDGTCNTECSANGDCAGGYICNSENECVQGGTTGTACSADSQCSGGYLCNTDAGVCFTACTDGSECGDDYQCSNALCELIPAQPYTQVAILSEVASSSNDVQRTNTPGPDIDAIELIQGGATFQASAIKANVPGVVGPDGNEASNQNDVLGARDAMTGNGPEYDCNVNADYLSLGANDGFVVVTFGNNAEIENGAQIKVWELADEHCEQSLPTRDDSYSVYIAQDIVATTAANIRTGEWCSLGNKVGGGIGTFNVNLATCEN